MTKNDQHLILVITSPTCFCLELGAEVHAHRAAVIHKNLSKYVVKVGGTHRNSDNAFFLPTKAFIHILLH